MNRSEIKLLMGLLKESNLITSSITEDMNNARNVGGEYAMDQQIRAEGVAAWMESRIKDGTNVIDAYVILNSYWLRRRLQQDEFDIIFEANLNLTFQNPQSDEEM